jgi:hypothetical protein
MKRGFLYLQTHPEHPGLVRVLTQEKLPELAGPNGETHIRYVACFEDIEAGQMHLHNGMRRGLVDLENRIYRGELERMIACVEADDLDHSRVWIDPALSGEAVRNIEVLTARMRAGARRRDRIWQAVGIAAILLLLLNSL